LAQAKKIIIEATGGATAQTYSFLQMASASRLSTRADLANFEAVKYVQKLSEKLGSAALAQLANRMNAAARMGAAAGEDPFAKVKGLISEMIERLLKEAEADAAHKGYCDKEMSETKAKKEELTDEIEALTTKIDKMSADSAKLKEEVATLSKELADLAKSQAEMDKVREEESTAFVANKKEMEEGLEGIKLALKVLRDYYAKEDKAHQAAEGAGGGIIGMLEVIESDFSKGLAEMISVEETAAAEYEQQTKDNEIAKTTKEQDVKYKTKEAKSLDKAVAEHTSDREGLQTELDAVLDYWEKIKEQCIAKAEPYEERKKRREAEIAGLKEALAILEGEAALLQKNVRRHRSFRHGHSA
jgi:chromosome segregation ATPase